MLVGPNCQYICFYRKAVFLLTDAYQISLNSHNFYLHRNNFVEGLFENLVFSQAVFEIWCYFSSH